MADRIKIAIDAMGSDNGPESLISGAAISKERYPEIYYTFLGKENLLKDIIIKHKIFNNSYRILDTPEIINPDDKPSHVIRKRKDSSMGVAIKELSEKRVDALVSAGNTGALMGMSKLQLKTLEGIQRPAIAATIPNLQGEFVLLDLGANIDCNAIMLLQFALMGVEFAKVILGKDKPRVGILNVGTEKEKGKLYIQEASKMIENSYLAENFIGFVEGNEITMGKVDVVITDGFTGNIALKTAEGVAKLSSSYIKSIFSNSLSGKISYLLMKKSLNTLKHKLDPRNRNGALLLGLNGIVVKSHGGADSLGFAAAIDIAFEFAKLGVGDKIIKNLHNLNVQEKELQND